MAGLSADVTQHLREEDGVKSEPPTLLTQGEQKDSQKQALTFLFVSHQPEPSYLTTDVINGYRGGYESGSLLFPISTRMWTKDKGVRGEERSTSNSVWQKFHCYFLQQPGTGFTCCVP